ncbi:polysaccharide pyruvyl transferase family protein [Planococcus chinensis]|uniref:Polysaccharide pyruvyl transferase family protein n=1 Tax=Planococcus chinensis TaxID=272917 RepID=A0ABW4QEJ6_9BACL
MRKIAILTLNGYFNYGNRLQNYALQEILEKKGFKVETIKNNTDHKKLKFIESKNSLVSYYLKKIFSKDIFGKLHLHFIYTIYGKNANEERSLMFKEFSTKHITESDFQIAINDIPRNFSEEYDFFVTGSDQVWNPVFRFGSSLDFLTFAPKEKRIAYAPSFGITKIPITYVERYKKWLSEMSGISVREIEGAKLIKELTGRDAEVLIDPTLLLTKEEWLKIKKPHINKPDGKYLLTYFLSEISSETARTIIETAKLHDLEIVNLANIKEKKYYSTGPSEFLDYINSASIFFTDSFHGAVFSILFETPFLVYEREGNLPSMNSRIDTLLSTFKLETRKGNVKDVNSEIIDLDFSHLKIILSKERAKAHNYLDYYLK